MILNDLKISLNGLFVFLLFFALFLFITPVSYATDDSYKPQTLTIIGKVPLSPQFAYAMSKNSQAESNIFSPSVNDMVFIKLHLLGAHDTFLPNQMIAMRIRDSVKQKVYEEVIKTDETGLAVFHFRVAENMSGTMQIEFANLTYAEPIRLKTTLSFTVQNNQSSYREWTIDVHEQASNLISTDIFPKKIRDVKVNSIFVFTDIKNGKNNNSITDCIDYFARAGPTLKI